MNNSIIIKTKISNIMNIENKIPIELKKSTQSMNFGKSIRFKANIHNQQSTPLMQKSNINIKSKQFQLNSSKNTFLSNIRRTESMDVDQQSVRIKTVRFEDSQDINDMSMSSLQTSRNKKKTTSILKKNSSQDLSVNSCNSDMGNLDTLSANNSLKDKGRQCTNINYEKALKQLKYQNNKYFDTLFPPGGASLCYSKAKIQQFSNVRWMRLEEVFKSNRLVMCHKKEQYKCIIANGYFKYFQEMAISLNAISNSNRCISRIFEEQKYLGLCIYYLRINHNGIWKYIIIDDYIPVIKTEHGVVPAFLNVYQNSQKQIQIWPFLIQKCLAKMYNCYQCLFNDTAENIIYELTGFYHEQFNLDDDNENFKFKNSLLHTQTVSIVSNAKNNKFFNEKLYALREGNYQNSNTYFNSDIRLKLIDMNNRCNYLMQAGDISQQFKTAKIFKIEDTYYSLGCVIKQIKHSTTLRKFIIKDRQCNCMISLVQRDKKYYRNNGYDYVWGRIILVTKDGINGYRWIEGKYQKNRIITLKCWLQPGQYYVIINGDWRDKVYEMNLNYQGTQEIQFVRQTLQNNPTILNETCVDIAQRFGALVQLNKNICSYRIIDKKNGFIIENVNNQISRPVFFHKQYHLQGTNYELIDKTKYSEEQPQQNYIQTKILPNQNFTFIVKFINGFDQKLLNNFRF